MSRDARKKQKQRLKREQKRRETRRSHALTPLDRIARTGGELECYVNSNWQDMGMAMLHVLGRAPDGRHAYAGFLVDVWCVGLKDVSGQREISRPQFEEVIDLVREEQPVARVTVVEARRLVGAGIRFARQNGFKLPPHYDRWTAIFGDLGDVASADLTGFGVEGGLRYVGTKAFLQRRLAGCSVEEFLNRADVTWVLGDGTLRDPAEGDYSFDFGEEEDDDEDELELDGPEREVFAELAHSIANVADEAEDAVRRWCFETRQTPHPRLREALNTLLVSVVPMAAYMQAVQEDPGAAEEMEVPSFEEITAMNLDRLPPTERESLEEAMDQVNDCIRQFKSPVEMLAWFYGDSQPPGDALPPPPSH